MNDQKSKLTSVLMLASRVSNTPLSVGEGTSPPFGFAMTETVNEPLHAKCSKYYWHFYYRLMPAIVYGVDFNNGRNYFKKYFFPIFTSGAIGSTGWLLASTYTCNKQEKFQVIARSYS
jgi:hypothetical protein